MLVSLDVNIVLEPCGTTTPMEGNKVQGFFSMEGPFESDRFHQYNVAKTAEKCHNGRQVG